MSAVPLRTLRLIGKDAGYYERHVGQSGEIYYDSTNQILRLYPGNVRDGKILADREWVNLAISTIQVGSATGVNTGDQVLPTLLSLGAQAAGTYATGTGSASGTNTGDQILPTLLSLGAQPAGIYANGTGSASGVNTGDQTLPTTLPASDVYAWAKSPTKPTYTYQEVGAQRSGVYASGTGSASGTNTGDQTLPTLASLGAQSSLGFTPYNATNPSGYITSADNIATATTANALNTSNAYTGTAFNDTSGNLRSVPQNSQGGAYTLVAADNGKHVSVTIGGVTVPASVMSAGMVVTIYNNSASAQTITQGAGLTLQWAGQAASTTGNRTLGLYGICTILFISSTLAVISGAGTT